MSVIDNIFYSKETDLKDNQLYLGNQNIHLYKDWLTFCCNESRTVQEKWLEKGAVCKNAFHENGCRMYPNSQ